jgi:biotin synthase
MSDVRSKAVRHDWSVDEIVKLFELPFLDLVFRAAEIHRSYQDGAIQLASLLSIKIGGCPENCGYCAQSSHYAKDTGTHKQPLMEVGAVLEKAKMAKEAGASRFCMGAPGRDLRDDAEFDRILEMIKGIRALGLEVCVTLGHVKPHQAQRMAEAGLTAYNHNLDTGPDYYNKIVTTRTYQDRLKTLDVLRSAGIGLCCGGIIGMGESVADRAGLLQVLANMNPHPENVPINALIAIKGTPLQDRPPVDPLDFVRMIAVARILMPKTRVRLSAGRRKLSREAQALCFMAGANSIFYGEKLLTADNNDAVADLKLLADLGLKTTEKTDARLETEAMES